MLHNLPKDVLLLVLEQIPDRNDLKQLCEVSKTLYAFAIPKLYENIVIWAEDEEHLERVQVEPFLGTGSTSAGRLDHVRTVEIRSRFDDLLAERCLHWKNMEFYVGEPRNSERRTGFDMLAAHLMPLFKQLREKSLRSFSWEMGTCVPVQILGDRGYMNSKQNSIESINLITGGACPINIDGKNPINLSAFRSLRDISWTGLRSLEEFDALSSALKNNSGHLRKLQLDFFNWSEEDWGADDSENVFASRVLNLPADKFEIMFPALETLSLSAISLENAEKRVAYALNFSGLSSLTLRHCSGSEYFLSTVIDSRQTIRLSLLEVVYGLSDGDIDMCGTLSAFLGSFQGLNDLFVTLPGPVETIEFWHALAHHKSTLTRFVCHQRTINLNENSSQFEEEMDLLDLSLLPEDRTKLNQSGSHHPFAALNLECIGLGCTPRIMKSILVPFTSTQSLKILHIRRSGSDIKGRMRGATGSSFENWDEESDDDSMEDDDPGADPDPDVLSAYDSASEDGSSNESTTKGGKPPSMTYSTASSESFDKAEILRLPGEFVAFANWAFGPDGLPTLQVLAFGDFSYDGRFNHIHNHLLCRHTWSIRAPENSISRPEVDEMILNFRPVRKNDRELWDLIDRNIDFLGACPTDSIMTD